MIGMITLGLGVLLFRFIGTVLRAKGYPPALAIAGWLFCTAALWLVSGAFGAWFPLWPALVGGVAGWLAALRWDGWACRATVDVLVVVVAWTFSFQVLSPAACGLLALSAASGGLILDRLIERTMKQPLSVHVVSAKFVVASCICVMVMSGFLGASIASPGNAVRRFADAAPSMPHLALTTSPRGHRLELSTGSVAWMEKPARSDTSVGAVFFHGNNSLGSDQKAAVALRRSLLEADFAVLSVDHPGYGASPLPESMHDECAWDPTATGAAAVEAMRQQPGIEQLVLIGHSMGCSDVLRLLAAGVQADAAVLFGAGLPEPRRFDGYWHTRFHQDRRLSTELPAPLVLEIRQRYYNNQRLALSLPTSHPPVHFVRFLAEKDNIVSTRDSLLEMIPGPRQAWDLAAGHYLGTYGWADLVLADTRAARNCIHLLEVIHLAVTRSASVVPGAPQRSLPDSDVADEVQEGGSRLNDRREVSHINDAPVKQDRAIRPSVNNVPFKNYL